MSGGEDLPRILAAAAPAFATAVAAGWMRAVAARRKLAAEREARPDAGVAHWAPAHLWAGPLCATVFGGFLAFALFYERGSWTVWLFALATLAGLWMSFAFFAFRLRWDDEGLEQVRWRGATRRFRWQDLREVRRREVWTLNRLDFGATGRVSVADDLIGAEALVARARRALGEG